MEVFLLPSSPAALRAAIYFLKRSSEVLFLRLLFFLGFNFFFGLDGFPKFFNIMHPSRENQI